MRIYNDYLITAGQDGAIVTTLLSQNKKPEVVAKWKPETEANANKQMNNQMAQIISAMEIADEIKKDGTKSSQVMILGFCDGAVRVYDITTTGFYLRANLFIH